MRGSHLVGHSLGAAVVLSLALARPEAAASLTLVSAAGLGGGDDTAFVEPFLDAGDRPALHAALAPLYADPAPLSEDLLDAVLAHKAGPGVVATWRRLAENAVRRDLPAARLRGRLSELDLPVKVIWGEVDRVCPVSHCRGLPGRVGVHVFADKGHMMPIEAATEVNRLVREIAATG